MDKKNYIHWEDNGFHIGYLTEFPDYRTQGESLNELQENLKDIYKELTGGAIPCIRRVSELDV